MTASSGIAVVITCFNLGRTLEEAVASVHSQTLLPDEIVIVDDGSTDIFTRQVLNRLEQRGERIERRTNCGVSAARNHGAEVTRGEFLVFLDADDAFEPRYFEVAMAQFDGDPGLGFVSSGQRGFGAAEYEWRAPEPQLPESIAHGVVHISSVMRRQVFEAAGGWREGLTAYEELDFWTTVMALGFRGTVLTEPMLRYRVRPDSMWHRALETENHLRLMGEYFDRHWSTIAQNGMELLVAKEQFILDQRQHQHHLVHLKDQAEAELHVLQERIEELTVELQRHGSDRVDWGGLRRLEPLSPKWGLDRGRPLDRYYIEAFLERWRGDIVGDVLEIKDSFYTETYGGERVRSRAVLDIDPHNHRATIVADLCAADQIPSASFDCFILTQTLNVIYDVRQAMTHAVRILKPGGVLLITVSALNRISYEDGGLDGDYWRFTEASLRALCAEVLPVDAFTVSGFGNVLACTALLQGIAIHELRSEELEHHDPYFPLVYGVRAVKPRRGGLTGASEPRAAILMYHRIGDDGLDPLGLCVPPAVFEAHLRVLAERFAVVSLDDMVADLAAGRVRDRSVAITFDDGYLDNLEIAAPLLAACDFPATFFVTGEGLESPIEYWWDSLVELFLGGGRLPQRLALEIAGRHYDLATGNQVERRHAHDRLWDVLFPLDPTSRRLAINLLYRWSGQERGFAPGRRPMLAAEVKRLASHARVTIGSHSTHHLRLDVQPPALRRDEISDNKRTLEGLLAGHVSLFAYPFGAFDASVVEDIREAGFEAAVTVEQAPVTASSDRFRLPRLDVSAWDAVSFERHLREVLMKDV